MSEVLTFSDQFEVECIGEKEEWVYDIEVDDNHNFFGNSICVHNSIYVNVEEVVNKAFPDGEEDKTKIVSFLDNLCSKRMEPELKRVYDKLHKYTNAFENDMNMDREVIANRGIWTGKKRYVLNVYDNEGVRYENPELKIMGLEAVRSSTPMICREKYKEAMRIIMDKEEEDLQEFVESFKQDFYNMPFEDVAFPRGCNDMEKWASPITIYSKGTPIGVKSALIHNDYVKKLNIDNKYPLIRSGDKIKFCYLTLPNVVKSPVIGAINELPEEFNLNDSIDYDLQFEKAFLKPITSITNAIGWTPEKVADFTEWI